MAPPRTSAALRMKKLQLSNTDFSSRVWKSGAEAPSFRQLPGIVPSPRESALVPFQLNGPM